MTSHCEQKILERGGRKWLARTFYPRPDAAMEAVTDMIVPLYGVEHDFRSGRFHAYTTEPLEQSVLVDLSKFDDEDERCAYVEMLLDWVAGGDGRWNLVIPNRSGLMLDFSFEDPITGGMFDLLFAGNAKSNVFA